MEMEQAGTQGTRGPETVADLRRALGDSRNLFVMGSDGNPQADLDHCADGTIVVWSERVQTGTRRWFVALAERGHVDSMYAVASFIHESDACRFAWEKSICG